MSYTFKIGQEVVCVDPKKSDNTSLNTPNHGEQRLVIGVKYCSACGSQSVNIGAISTIDYQAICRKCRGKCYTPTGVEWFSSSRFVPLEEFKQSEPALTELLNEIKIEI